MCRRRSVSLSLPLRTSIFVSHRNPATGAVAAAASHLRQAKEKEKSHQNLVEVQFYLFFQVEIFSMENLFCFVQKFHLLSNEAVAAVGCRSESRLHIYLFNAIKLMGWQTENDSVFAAMKKKCEENGKKQITTATFKNAKTKRFVAVAAAWYAFSDVSLHVR